MHKTKINIVCPNKKKLNIKVNKPYIVHMTFELRSTDKPYAMKLQSITQYLCAQ